jgi:hypothetical protein
LLKIDFWEIRSAKGSDETPPYKPRFHRAPHISALLPGLTPRLPNYPEDQNAGKTPHQHPKTPVLPDHREEDQDAAAMIFVSSKIGIR